MDYPFGSEGCSAIQDFDQQECCIRHDWLYWQGGSIQDRTRADREFFQCVRRTRSGWVAALRWLGVRIGGLGFLPFYDWRWGYGWEYPRSRAPENDNSPYTVETERPTFEKRLAQAREHDRRMREKGALDPAVELDRPPDENRCTRAVDWGTLTVPGWPKRRSQMKAWVENFALSRVSRRRLWLYVALLPSVWVIAGCEGIIITPKPDSTPPPGATHFACPTVPSSVGACGDVHFLDTSLSCGGTGRMSIATSTATGGATRFTVGFQNGTRFSGKLITPDPGCWIKDGITVTMIFGVVYTGDQGVESGTTTPCIVQSKVDFTTFTFDPLDFSPFESTAKGQIHQQIDNAVINTLFGSSGVLPGRCARWRQMP